MRSDRERLLDVLEALDNIERHKPSSRSDLDEDELLQVWNIHHLQVIGEAMSRVSQPLRDAHREVPWREIIGMRQVLVHGYFEVDPDIVWEAITTGISGLRKQVSAMYEEAG